MMMQKSNRILVFGEGGAYKSAVIFDLCVAVASEKNKLIRELDVKHHGPVLINSTEGSIFDNKNRLLSHMRAHGVNPAVLPLHFCQQPFCLDDQLDVQELEYHLKEIKPVLVVLDPLDSFFSGDENSSKETKALRREIDRMIDEYQCTFVVIHHQTKQGPKSEGKATPRGSTAWYGWADAVLHFKSYKKKIGLPTATEIVTVESQKQRNGAKGHIFSAVPIIDDVLKLTYFVYYNGKDAEGVTCAFYKFQIYRALRASNAPMTNLMLAEAIGVRAEKLTEPLELLEAEGLIAKDASVPRAFGEGGLKIRAVPAWQARIPMSAVDGAKIMIDDEEIELQQMLVDPLPPGTALADEQDDGGLRPVGAPA